MKNILIVDDEPLNIIYVSSLLWRHLDTHNIPFTLHKKSCWEEAIEIAKWKKMDIIIIDYSMPGLNWWETIHRLRKSWWDWIWIWYTSHSMWKVWDHFLSSWTNKVYLKHEEMPKMLEYINRTLGIGSGRTM